MDLRRQSLQSALEAFQKELLHFFQNRLVATSLKTLGGRPVN
jgi:hypothetical protein